MYICLRKDKVIFYMYRACLRKRFAFALWPFMPWCIALHFPYQNKDPITYSALYESKIPHLILTLPHLISSIFYVSFIRHLDLILWYIKSIVILDSCICQNSKTIQGNTSLHKHGIYIISHFICSHSISFYISFMFIPYHLHFIRHSFMRKTCGKF